MTSPRAIESLWYTRCSVPTPVGVAAQLGWFKDEFENDGFPVNSLRDAEAEEQLASHFEHSLEDSFRQGGSVPAIWARSRGRDTRVIALTWTDEFQAIVAAPGSKIRSVKDLAGARFGLPKHNITIDHNRASALRALKVALELEGISSRSVEIIDLPDPGADGPARRGLSRRQSGHTYSNEALALARGQVDAVYVKDARGLELIDLIGAQVIASFGFHPDPYVRVSNCAPRPLTVSGGLVRERPDIVDRLLTRVIAAGHWTASRPTATIELIAEETGWSTRAVRRSYGAKVHLALAAELEPEAATALQTFSDFLHEEGFIPHPVDVAQWIDPNPMRRVIERGLVHAEHAL